MPTNNINIPLSAKCVGVVIMDSIHYKNKIMELLYDKNIYKQISRPTRSKNWAILYKFNQNLIPKEDKF